MASSFWAGSNDTWTIDKPVGPGQWNRKEDVELIQSMLKDVLTSPAITDAVSAQERAEIERIITASTRNGRGFADGIYGANTRAATGVLERYIGSPYKDGIIRPMGEIDQTGRISGSVGTKMLELNNIWDANSITDEANSKKESGRKWLSPSLFSLLYPDG